MIRAFTAENINFRKRVVFPSFQGLPTKVKQARHLVHTIYTSHARPVKLKITLVLRGRGTSIFKIVSIPLAWQKICINREQTSLEMYKVDLTCSCDQSGALDIFLF